MGQAKSLLLFLLCIPLWIHCNASGNSGGGRGGGPAAAAFLLNNCPTSFLSKATATTTTISPSPFKLHNFTPTSASRKMKMVMMTNNQHDANTVTTDNNQNEQLPYNKELFNQYATVMEEVLQSRRVLRNIKEEDIQMVSKYLLQNKQYSSTTTTTNYSQMTEGELRSNIAKSKDTYLTQTQLTPAQYKLALMALTYMGDYCAKKRVSIPLLVAWYIVKDGGMILRDKAYGTYLYVLSSIDHNNNGVSAAPLKGEEEEERTRVAEEVATIHDILFQPDEKTLSVRVKNMVKRGDEHGAMELLSSVSTGNQELKQRTYLPILQSYCAKGNIDCALKLYKNMYDQKSVIFEADEQALFIASVAKAGYFRNDSNPVKGAEEIGYSPAHGTEFFDRLVSDMANDVLEISSSAALKLYHAFKVGFHDAMDLSDDVVSLTKKKDEMEGTTTATEGYIQEEEEETLVLNNKQANHDELVVSRVKVNRTTAICQRTNATLRLIMLEEEQGQQLHDTLIQMADAQYEAFEAKNKAKKPKIRKEGGVGSNDNKGSDDPHFAGKQLSNFVDWVNTREGEPFTAIVDGANVAYFGQGHVDYLQLKLMVETLENMNENPLVIMPQKYTNSKFRVSSKFLQKLTPEDLEIIEGFEAKGQLFKVPALCLDDYYWMLASVSDQTVSRNGTNIDVPTDNDDGRWPGIRPMLISNDQMRDHKLELLEPRLFRRWCSSHIVNYSVKNNKTEISFFAADFFSREIQGNPTPAPFSLSGQEESGNGATAWHFPVSDWDNHERLCIRIPYH